MKIGHSVPSSRKFWLQRWWLTPSRLETNASGVDISLFNMHHHRDGQDRIVKLAVSIDGAEERGGERERQRGKEQATEGISGGAERNSAGCNYPEPINDKKKLTKIVLELKTISFYH